MFNAYGLSLVLHPYNPFVPTIHMNIRLFELLNEKGSVVDSWFGGGVDLTPYYIFKEDITFFITIIKLFVMNLILKSIESLKKNVTVTSGILTEMKQEELVDYFLTI